MVIGVSRRAYRDDVVVVAQVRVSGRARLALSTSGPRVNDDDITDPDVALGLGDFATDGEHLAAHVVSCSFEI